MAPTTAPRKILLVEDDPDLARLARMALEDHGYRVTHAADGARGCEEALEREHDLLLLDLTLPEVDGLEICRRVRNGERYLPILMLTARGDEVDRVLGLEVGADDYLTKPLSLRELVARVRAIFRRVDALGASSEAEDSVAGEGLVERGTLSIDAARRKVSLAGATLELTAKEHDLLALFASRPGRVFTRNDLLEALWGPGYEGYEHTVNSHINRLRAKINRGGPRQQFIETVWGVGYRFAEGPWD